MKEEETRKEEEIICEEKSEVADVQNECPVPKTEEEMKLAFLKKMQAFRTDLTKCDWSDNKVCNMKGSGSFPYISTDKIKAQMNPVFIRNGLHWHINYEDARMLTEPNASPTRWIVTLSANVMDVDTGYSETTKVFGEGSDYGDKGLAKACTYALKTWLSDMGLIASGIDPDAVYGSTTGSFVPRSPSEEVKVQSKITSAPSVVKAPSVKAPIKAPVLDKKAEAVKEEESSKTSVKAPVKAPKAEKKDDADKSEEGAPITIPQSNAIAGIVAKWTKAGEEGKVDAEVYNRMSADKLDVKTSSDAMKFIAKYRDLPGDVSE